MSTKTTTTIIPHTSFLYPVVKYATPTPPPTSAPASSEKDNSRSMAFLKVIYQRQEQMIGQIEELTKQMKRFTHLEQADDDADDQPVSKDRKKRNKCSAAIMTLTEKKQYILEEYPSSLISYAKWVRDYIRCTEAQLVSYIQRVQTPTDTTQVQRLFQEILQNAVDNLHATATTSNKVVPLIGLNPSQYMICNESGEWINAPLSLLEDLASTIWNTISCALHAYSKKHKVYSMEYNCALDVLLYFNLIKSSATEEDTRVLTKSTKILKPSLYQYHFGLCKKMIYKLVAMDATEYYDNDGWEAFFLREQEKEHLSNRYKELELQP
jgi:hypothetical protein